MSKFLALSGGGNRGMLQLGMILELYYECGIGWDCMAGISVGSLICAFLSQIRDFETDFEKEIHKLIQYFLQPSFRVAQPWINLGSYMNLLDASLFHSSIFNNTKIRELIDRWYSAENVNTPFFAGAYNKTLQRYETFSSTKDDMKQACLASSAIPVVFPEVEINGNMYQDGGMCHIIPIPEIKQWIQNTNGKKHIDIFMCFPIHNTSLFSKITTPRASVKLIGNAARMVSDLMLQSFEKDLYELSLLLKIPVNKLTQHSCGVFRNGDLTVRIFSPSTGHYHSIIHTTPRQRKQLVMDGQKIVKTFLKI